MSIKFKLPFLVFLAFLINILLLYMYYNFYLSREISQYNSSQQEQLAIETSRISKELDYGQDFTQRLTALSQEKNLILQVSSEAGETVFRAGNETGVNMQISASRLFHSGGGIYLLKVIQPLSLKDISSYAFVWYIFGMEVLILFTILLITAGVIYFNYAGPIVSLEKSMERFKEGIRPQVTARKDEIGLLHNRFVNLAETIEKEKEKQDLIIASISHDIKTPLTSIMGYTERLKKNGLSTERHDKYIDIIYNKSVSINNLIEEFDEYLNLHMQRGLQRQRISAEKFCNLLKSDYEEELTERGVAFTIRNDCPNETLFVDISKLRRVFGNIIGNSLKHFSHRQPSISVICTKQENNLLFSVEDNGMGILKEELQKIFDPFYTLDKSRSVAGLGLAICREIVEACGGKIWAENIEAGGLAVKISLPVYLP